MLCCSSVSDVGLVVFAFDAVGCCISVGGVGVRLFAVSWGWCGIKWSPTLNNWLVLSGKTSLSYLLLCIERMGKPSVPGFSLDVRLLAPLFLQPLWSEIFFSVGIFASH